MAEERDDLEVAWARIVADYDRDVDPSESGWPALEDIDDSDRGDGTSDTRSDATSDATSDPGADATTDPSVADEEPVDVFVAEPLVLDPDAARDTEAHFVPPTPPPLRRPDLPNGLAWGGLLGGPLLLLLTAVFGWDLPSLLDAACVIGFVGGLVFLVATMDDRRDNDGWDNGAQV